MFNKNDFMRLRKDKSSRQWIVFALLASLLLPLLMSALLLGLGHLSGCEIAGSPGQLCEVVGLNLGQAIKTLVGLTWGSVALGLFYVPPLGIALFVGLLILIYVCVPKQRRLVFSFLSICYVGFAPMILGILFVAFTAGLADCSLNEGGVGSCYLFGIDTADTFHAAAVMPWLIFFLIPLCTMITAFYAIALFVIDKFRK